MTNVDRNIKQMYVRMACIFMIPHSLLQNSTLKVYLLFCTSNQNHIFADSLPNSPFLILTSFHTECYSATFHSFHLTLRPYIIYKISTFLWLIELIKMCTLHTSRAPLYWKYVEARWWYCTNPFRQLMYYIFMIIIMSNALIK